MRWDRGHQSEDVIDERGRRSAAGGVNPNALFLLFRFASRFGWKGMVVATLLTGGVLYLQSQPLSTDTGPGDDEARQLVGSILDDVQITFAEQVPGYRRAKLVLFTGATTTGCGYGDAATGPFYCPLDERVYIDLLFYDELSKRFGAPGDFAEAYVIAHEIGHHVQHQLGTDDKVPKGRTALGASGASVRLELQADCYAGVWAASAARRNLLDVGDLDEGLTAAAAIGDDRLQRQLAGTVSPESFSHGTSAQRSRWLRKGFDAGTIDACDTFGAAEL
jgi:hypothetical protein